MKIEYVEKKLREGRFFLVRMTEHERMAFDNNEPFDFYLSAFLNAGMSVRNGFHVAAEIIHSKLGGRVGNRVLASQKNLSTNSCAKTELRRFIG